MMCVREKTRAKAYKEKDVSKNVDTYQHLPLRDLCDEHLRREDEGSDGGSVLDGVDRDLGGVQHTRHQEVLVVVRRRVVAEAERLVAALVRDHLTLQAGVFGDLLREGDRDRAESGLWLRL